MPAAALVLALAGAGLHAGWNTLLARSADTRAATAVALLAAVLGFAPLALLGGRVSGSAVPYVLVSAGLELCYFALLATAYRRAELSLIYPLARGLGPCFVLLVGLLVLGVSTSPIAAGGVLLVASGIVLVRGIRSSGGSLDVALAASIGACIAGYTLVDKAGLRFADPIPYFWLVTVLTCAGYLGAILLRRGRGALRGAVRLDNAFAGLAMFAAYALVLGALRIAPAASVAAVRESSVVIATLLGAVVLHERVGRGRLFGAGLVVFGVAVLALG